MPFSLTPSSNALGRVSLFDPLYVLSSLVAVGVGSLLEPLGSATWEYRLTLKLVPFQNHLQGGTICRYPILALPSLS